MNLRGQKFATNWSKKPEKLNDSTINLSVRVTETFGEPEKISVLSNGDVAFKYPTLNTVIQVKRTAVSVLTEEEYSGVIDFDSAVKYVKKAWKWRQ